MATNQVPITQLTLGTEVLDTDVYCGVDTTDLTMSPSGTTKKYSIGLLQSYLQEQNDNSVRQSCKVAATGALTATYNNGTDGIGATLTNSGSFAALVIDGESLSVGDRVLIQYQVNAFQNGIYTVTDIGSLVEPWILTRATDYDGSLSNQINQGDIVGITLGVANALTIWFQTNSGPFVLGTTDLTFETEINTVPVYVQSITPGTSAASKAIVLDASSNIDGVSWSSITSTASFVGALAYSPATINTALGYNIGIIPGVPAPNKSLVLDGSSNLDGVSIGSITIAGGYVGSLSVSPSDINTGIGYLDTLTPGFSSPSQAIVLDVASQIDSVPFSDITAAGTYVAGLTFPNVDINAVLTKLLYDAINIVVTPALGSCAISFTTSNVAGVALPSTTYIYIAPSVGIAGISATTGFFFGATSEGYISTDVNGDFAATITGAAGSYNLIVTLQVGFPVTIPFTIT